MRPRAVREAAERSAASGDQMTALFPPGSLPGEALPEIWEDWGGSVARSALSAAALVEAANQDAAASGGPQSTRAAFTRWAAPAAPAPPTSARGLTPAGYASMVR